MTISKDDKNYATHPKLRAFILLVWIIMLGAVSYGETYEPMKNEVGSKLQTIPVQPIIRLVI